MSIKQTITFFTFITFVSTGCVTYSIQKDSLVSQLKQNQKIFFNGLFPRFSILNSPSNYIDSIRCFDKKGNQVWLFPENNTTFTFIKKSTGKKVKANFNTIIFFNDSIFSRFNPFFGKVRTTPINDIDKIIIRVEKPKVKAVNK